VDGSSFEQHSDIFNSLIFLQELQNQMYQDKEKPKPIYRSRREKGIWNKLMMI